MIYKKIFHCQNLQLIISFQHSNPHPLFLLLLSSIYSVESYHQSICCSLITQCKNVAEFATADLTDSHSNIQVIATPMLAFGQLKSACGQAYTLKLYEDNSLVRSTLEQFDGIDRVLVIDGGGSRRCALVGDQIAELALKHKWNGIIVNGCIRDSNIINDMKIHIKAIGTNPLKSVKRNSGQAKIPISFDDNCGVVINQNDWIYSDSDGIVISKTKLH